jgi:hypothetical protein
MATNTLLFVAAVGLWLSSFVLVLVVTDRSTTRWLRQGPDENQASTRASYPDRNPT